MKFYPEPELPQYMATLSFGHTNDPTIQEAMRVQLAKLQIDINRFQRASTNYSKMKSLTRHSVVLVEVQKGADLYFDQICFQEPKPVVVVSVEPLGERLETFRGDPVIPSWYSFLSLKVHPTSEKLVIKAVCERNIGGRLELGRIEATLAELSDAKIRDDWFVLSTQKQFKEGETPRLKVRYQFIGDMSQLIAMHALKCQETLDQIKAAYDQLKELLESLHD